MKKSSVKLWQIFLVILVIAAIFTATTFDRNTHAIKYADNPFCQQAVERITKITKAKQGIFVSELSYSDNKNETCVLNLMVPHDGDRTQIWNDIYYAGDKKCPYRIKKSDAVLDNADGFPSLEDIYRKLQIFRAYKSDVFNQCKKKNPKKDEDSQMNLRGNFKFKDTIIYKQKFQSENKKKPEGQMVSKSDLKVLKDVPVFIVSSSGVQKKSYYPMAVTENSFLVYQIFTSKKDGSSYEQLCAIVNIY